MALNMWNDDKPRYLFPLGLSVMALPCIWKAYASNKHLKLNSN